MSVSTGTGKSFKVTVSGGKAPDSDGSDPIRGVGAKGRRYRQIPYLARMFRTEASFRQSID
jgi:hypothetical protein